jgi:polysaccharide deacetylase 2 family uncharacterized protein YibQ
MTQEMIAAVTALADLLARENAALADLDFRRAEAFLPDKTAAAAAFSAAHRQDRALPPMDATQRRAAERAAVRLRSVAEENRRTMAKAVARAAPRVPSAAYAANGMRPDSRRQPVMLSARA